MGGVEEWRRRDRRSGDINDIMGLLNQGPVWY